MISAVIKRHAQRSRVNPGISVAALCTQGIRGCAYAVICMGILAGMQAAQGQSGASAPSSQLRIVDANGLVRVARVVDGAVNVAVVVEGVRGGTDGECSATNVDGLAAEQRVAISAQGRCLFRKLTPGSWQVRLEFSAATAGAAEQGEGGARWRVEIE